ncbi:hypothetical protein DM02DRAFT_715853 [Periconia macrospinosa]|uniref:F-box domain-containing protein n=1 Tax=Periconia macrospinosa TaxID=97972 RepID=A0A2V1E425_9PLEO|nr:hypothetical protein DM02DRAFT_715853 [Periconia macrospinosa]
MNEHNRHSLLDSSIRLSKETNKTGAQPNHRQSWGYQDEDDATFATTHLQPPKPKPFPFLALPYEIRLHIYELLLSFPKTLDLDPSNPRTLIPNLRLFLVSRQIHAEASRAFYSLNTFRIFPINGRFFHAKYPLLARLPASYKTHITKLELRLGPGWTKPPKGWVIDEREGNRRRLRLADIQNVRLLKVFVECDPAASEVFNGFRHKEGRDFYTGFCVGLLNGLFEHLPSLERVEFDAYPSVPRNSPLLKGLLDEAKAGGKGILWGPERGWDKVVDVDLAGVLMKLGLEL